MTTVVNKSDGVRYDAYIGRGSPFGNPFVLGKDGSREEVIAKYKIYFHDRLKTEAIFRTQVMQLKDKVLCCFCAPKPCHGDVIVEFLDNLNQ